MLERTLLFATVLVAALGCATPIESGGSGGEGGEGGSGGSSATSTGSATSSSTGSGATTGSGTGTGGGPTNCADNLHLCDGKCVGNTVDTGCSKSTTCEPCVKPAKGIAFCAPEGTCDVQCDGGYTKSGLECTCMASCCNSGDCQQGQQCSNGQCVAPCDEQACIISCFSQGLIGQCTNNVCQCVSPF